MRKTLIFFIIGILLAQYFLGPAIPVLASEDTQQFINDANDLRNLGIFVGTGHGFELDKPLNKIEASAVLARLIEKKDSAVKMDYTVSYIDVPLWASSYVGYLCNNSWIEAKTPSEFGASDALSSEEYTALMLKLLGYDETSDFQPGHALDKAEEIGLFTASELQAIVQSPVFSRMQAVLVTYNTLKTPAKGDERALITKLVDEGGVNKDSVTIIEENNKVENIISYSKVSKSQTPQPVVFLGDSLTEGISRAESFKGVYTLNKGFNGYKTRRILDRINEVVSANPRKLFIMAGTNDLWGGEELAVTVKNYSLMLDIVKQHVPDCKIYIQSTLPFGEAALKKNALVSNDKVKNLNDQLMLLAAKYEAAYLDIGSLYKDSSGALDSRYSADGIHIRTENYGPWLKVIKTNMD